MGKNFPVRKAIIAWKDAENLSVIYQI